MIDHRDPRMTSTCKRPGRTCGNAKRFAHGTLDARRKSGKISDASCDTVARRCNEPNQIMNSIEHFGKYVIPEFEND